jgi:hypothetical protein
MNHQERFHKGKPKLNSNSKFNQGIFKPMNPDKYLGNLGSLVYRSGLELKWFKFFDLNPYIIQWKCEETIIHYHNPIDNKTHRYFIDVFIRYRTKKNEIKEALIEIKPLSQTRPPQQNKYKSKSYRYAVNQYIVNEAKWNAAVKIAKDNGMEFKILTETGFVSWNITN